MVRPSRNVSNMRRAAVQDQSAWNQLAADAAAMDRGPVDPQLVAWMRQQRPGSSRAWATGALATMPDDEVNPPPGAKLDTYPWARSWGSYLNAIRDRQDGTGARSVIRKVMDSRPLFTDAAMGERVPSEGGFLVPERLRITVLSYMQTGIIYPRATVVEMDSQRVPVPILDNPSQASSAQALGGMTFSFTEEGQAIPASVPNFGRLALEAWPDKALLKNVPNELLADATPFTEVFLPQTIAKGLSWHIDDYALNTGTGVGQPQALVNAPGAYAVTRGTGSKVLLADLATMFKALHPASKMSALAPGDTPVAWLISNSAMDQILELYLAVGTPTNTAVAPPDWYQAGDGREVGASILGIPVIVNDHQASVGSAGDVMLADLSLLLLGERSAMTVELGPGAGFASDTTHIRVRYRWDCRFWPQSNITLTTGQVTSGLVVLH